MNEDYFMDLAEEMKPEDITNSVLREFARRHGAGVAADLIRIYDEIYPTVPTTQRKLTIPLKSSFVKTINNRKINGTLV